jgi:uncharacterized repeat protein (TIGR04138 family)
MRRLHSAPHAIAASTATTALQHTHEFGLTRAVAHEFPHQRAANRNLHYAAAIANRPRGEDMAHRSSAASRSDKRGESAKTLRFGATAPMLKRMHDINFDEELDKIVAKDPRYTREAYLFVREALDHTQKMIVKQEKEEGPRHVSGRQLLEGSRDYALQQFGPMALTVLNEWGIRRCEDLGEIVFNMVENSLLAKTDQDTREDFAGGYDFEEAFRKPFVPVNRLTAKSPTPELKKV